MANQKKISELPLINALSGSAASVVPVVIGGTTNQVPVEAFIPITNAYSVLTSSFNTFSSSVEDRIGDLELTNTLQDAAITINGNNVEFTNDVFVNGMITAQQYNVTYVSSSVQYKSGSTEFGDSSDDTHTFIGTIVLNGLALGTSELMAQTASQNSINTGISAVTGAFATELGSIQTTLTGNRGELNGIEAYTASLKAQTIVSSSTQILNYNKFATTGSNTFKADQVITGSLSISAGEFNVTTGSGNVTSSLRFDHTQNNGVTLQLSHDNNGAFADHSFNVNVWSAGVYTEFVRNGTPYSILNVEAFDDNKIYLYRDTRLYNKSLVIDNNLIVQNGLVVGSGSLLVNGVITGSILATNGVISSSNQLFELNSQTGSQDLVNLGISSVTGSLIGITNGLMAFTSALDSTYATDAQLYQLYQATSSIHSSTASLNLQTGSQNSINSGISAVTGAFATELGSIDSHIVGISTYTSSVNTQLSSIDSHILKQSTQTGSQDLVNLRISSTTGSINTTTSSFDSVFLGISSVTGAMNTQSSSQDGVNLGISTYTGSQNVINSSVDAHILGISTYTSSLFVSSSVSGSVIKLHKQDSTTQQMKIPRGLGYSGLGWARYDDTTYTTASALTIIDGVDTKIPCNASSSIETHMHSSVSFFNPVSQTIRAENEGDVYVITLDFTMQAATTPADADFVRLQMNNTVGTPYTRVGRDLFFQKKDTEWHKYHEIFQYYSDSDFVLNGNEFNIIPNGVNVNVADVIIFIQRTQNHSQDLDL